MVHLVLSTTRGNSGNRYFPHQGYLGLTPVRVEGVVRTKLDEDGKPIPARALSISIRCYQSRLTRSRTFRSTLVVDHTDVLWVKPPDKEYADVAELDFPFKLTLPKRTPGFSTANYQDYRVFWRLEAVLDHVRIPKVGSRIVRYYDLGLVRYDLPPSRPLKHPSEPHSSTHALLHQTSKPRAPVVRYNVSVPTIPVGPADVFLATVSMQPLDRAVTVRSATVSVERRIDLHNIPAAPTPLVTAGINHTAAAAPSPGPALSPASPTSSSNSDDQSEDASTPTTSRFAQSRAGSDVSPYASSSGSYATFDSVASNFSSSSSRPLLSPSSSGPTPPIPIPRSHSAPSPNPSPSSSFTPLSPSSSASSESPLKTLTSTLVSSDSGPFSCDAAGVWSKTLTLQWPENRGHYRWAIGETMQSDFASVRFFVRTKVVVHGPGGTDTLELEPTELTVVSTNEAERRSAMEKWAEQKEGALRSKSKSPWRRRGDEGGADGPPPSSATSSTHGKSSGYGLPSPPQTPAHSPEGSDGRKLSSANGSSSKPPRKKASRRPHTSAGPRDKSNFAYSAPAEMMSLRSEPDHDQTASRHSASSSSTSHGHSHVGKRLRESGLGESMLYAVDIVKGKSRAREGEKRARDETKSHEERERERQRERVKNTGLGLQLGLEREQVRAWEEELARIELQSRRSSAGMLGLWGTSRRRNGG
ncbi:hypothetical protein PYCCODRAFT_1467563 [Trametes coccinea BRFM310]|uniref:Uncharacterized protein n=1 Tax=Trametes coccinea (strain BRFM310) TaxID=1353009 RepID=A0A1Y2IP41_TRAC3|nr:hypothetical protein PYCCODRAFT_1467563 [Trametes coccinea BRFM310]